MGTTKPMTIADWIAEADRLEAENKRLREALEKIHGLLYIPEGAPLKEFVGHHQIRAAMMTARAALEGKE